MKTIFENNGLIVQVNDHEEIFISSRNGKCSLRISSEENKVLACVDPHFLDNKSRICQGKFCDIGGDPYFEVSTRDNNACQCQECYWEIALSEIV